MATNWKKLRRADRLTRFADPRFAALRAANPERFTGRKRGRNGRRAPAAKREWFRALIELRSPLTASEFAAGFWDTGRKAPKGWEQWMRIPPVYSNLPAGLGKITFCTALVSGEFFQTLRTSRLLQRAIRRFQLGFPTILESNAPVATPSLMLATGTSGTVVTGIIDDGIAFAHERFRHADGTTRIEYFWDQDQRWSTTGPWPGVLTTDAFFYGRELKKYDTVNSLGIPVPGIDKLMTNATSAGAVDEEGVYQATRHLDYAHPEHKAVAWRISHGTHVMDLACGFDPSAAPPDRPIIAVQLPGKTTADTSGRQLDPYVYDALLYILGRTDDVAAKYQTGPLPVVVNMSYGVIAPNDYTEILVPAIDQLIRDRAALGVPLAVTLPSGNAFLARCHARFRLGAPGATRTLRWHLQPGDATDNLLEIWLPASTANPYPYRVQVKVRTPTGDESPWINEGDLPWVWPYGGGTVCSVVYEDATAAWHRNRIGLCVNPTFSVDSSTPVAPSGDWTITVRHAGLSGAPPVRIVAWVQRDDSPYGYPRRGRQSRFEDPDYLRFHPITGREVEQELQPASYVNRFGTINRLATGSQTIVLGGFRRSDRVPAKYAAAGPVVRPVGVLPPYRDGPDAMAPSEDSPACHGQLGAGARSGGAVAMAGTSVASPRIARWIADQMAIVGAPHDRPAVVQLAQSPPNGVPIAVPSPPPPTPLAQLWRAGAGGIDIDAPGAPTVVPQVRPRMGIQRRER